MASDGADVPAVETEKHPQKVQVWGMMSSCVLSELHVVTSRTTVNGEYYRENIISKEGLDALTRTAKNGSVVERRMVESQDRATFMQTVHLPTRPVRPSCGAKSTSLGSGRGVSGQGTVRT